MFTKTVEYGNGHTREELNILSIIITTIITIFALSVIIGGFYTVQPGQVAFEKTLGKIDGDIKTEGLYFKLPFITSSIKTNIRNIIVTTKATAASKDVQDVTTELAVNFSIQASSAIDLYTTVGSVETITDKIVAKAIQESLKSATANFTATETITKRGELRDLMIKNLTAKLEPRGIVINQVDILNLTFSDSFNNAIEAKVTAEQDALKAKALVAKVQYEAESKVAKAKGEAEAITIKAQAEAEAIAIKAKAIQVQGGDDYIKLRWIEEWSGQLPTTMLGDGTDILIDLR